MNKLAEQLLRYELDHRSDAQQPAGQRRNAGSRFRNVKAGAEAEREGSKAEMAGWDDYLFLCQAALGREVACVAEPSQSLTMNTNDNQQARGGDLCRQFKGRVTQLILWCQQWENLKPSFVEKSLVCIFFIGWR